MQMQRVARPFLYPGRDIHGRQGECVDTNVEISGHGRVYLSVDAVKVAGRALGFPSPERHIELEGELEAAQAGLAAAVEQVELMRPAYAAVQQAAAAMHGIAGIAEPTVTARDDNGHIVATTLTDHLQSGAGRVVAGGKVVYSKGEAS